MHIKSLEVTNYRSLKDIKVDFNPMLALLGPNGAGKSSVLRALEVFYDLTAGVSVHDFYQEDTSLPISIRVTYHELNEREKEEFSGYLTVEGELIVTKRISLEGGKMAQRYYGATRQLPLFAENVRQFSGKKDRVDAYRGIKDSFTPPLPTAASWEKVNEAMGAYEAAHPELLELRENEEQFFGPKNVGGGKLDKYTRYILIPAVRDASGETEKKGVIAELVDLVVMKQIAARPDIKDFQQRFSDEAKQVFSSANLPEIIDLASGITGVLQQYAPEATLNLEWDEYVPPRLGLPPVVATLKEEGTQFACDISRKGHGLQRALILSLLQYLAQLPTPRLGEDGETVTASDPDLILGIEEPELYLHPIKCQHLYRVLARLSEKRESGALGMQVVYATHSPYFLSLEEFESIRIVRRTRPAVEDAAPFATCYQAAKSLVNERLAHVNDLDPSDFSEASFVARGRPVMTMVVNEGFFAEKVVVVEGPADVGFLTAISEQLNFFWREKGIVVVAADGKHKMDRIVVIFGALGIPTFHLWDADLPSPEKQESASDRSNRYKRNRCLQRLGGIAVGQLADAPSTYVHANHGVFERKLEAEISLSLGSRYEEIVSAAGAELGIEKVLKSADGAARVVQLSYEAELNFPVFEEIVTRINAL